ncbi:MAG: winged helix-turn-helix transcriptional regulator [Nitrososphaerota archaeon]
MRLKFTYFLPKVARYGGYEILKALESGPKIWKELEQVEEMNSAKLGRRLKDLLETGVIHVVIVPNKPTGSKAYELTDLGRKVLQKLIELEQIYNEEMKKAPPKGEKFLEGDKNGENF